MRPSSSALLGLAALFIPGLALAEPAAFQIEDVPAGIYGGTPVAACAWPTTVSMQGACSGTLVHPQVVIYAAHCGSQYSQVIFGEYADSSKRTIATDYCKTYNGNGSGTDFAFCVLKEPQLDLPIVPVLMGCETDILQPGQEVTIVGFGDADNGPYGTKREVVTTINSIQNDEAFIGGGGKDSCQGDSGGPVFVQLADGSWRVFGITSYGGQCGTGGYYSMMHLGMQWFEDETGIDLTPCHQADGAWDPGFDCTNFPLDPGLGGGKWPEGCPGGEFSGYSATCGAAFDPVPDETPPTVTITLPTDQQMFETPEMMGNAPVTVTIDAQDEGWGMKEVHILVNGKDIGGVDNAMPYEFLLEFPSGGWKIGARAVDKADNEAFAEEVQIWVNTEPPPPEPMTTTGDIGGDGSSGSGTGGGEDPTTGAPEDPTTGGPIDPTLGGTTTDGATSGQAGEGDGCGCRSTGDGAPGALLFGLGLLAAGRRRGARRR